MLDSVHEGKNDQSLDGKQPEAMLCRLICHGWDLKLICLRLETIGKAVDSNSLTALLWWLWGDKWDWEKCEIIKNL